VTALALGVPGLAPSTGNPYAAGSTGYDVSYPQCGGHASPRGAFGIVGVNGGKPFTYNQCLSSLYKEARRSVAASLYLNTGYDDSYVKSISSNCSRLSNGEAGTSDQQLAWAIGCSEAERSLDFAYRQDATNVAMWWLDVESANSWSTSDLTLNQFALQGAVSRLSQTGLRVGVYSTSLMWVEITGGNFTPTGVVADWVAGGNCKTPFTSSPVWLDQSVVGGVDRNYACSL
jgi:hypothetical protein